MERDPKLCQIIAVSKGTQADTQSVISKLHHTNKKPALFEGQTRTFEPIDEEYQLPPESTRVQQRADDQVAAFVESFSELLNVQFTKDVGNTLAKADVVVDGRTILSDAPATFLLALEKELEKVNTFFGELPELDPAENWEFDTNSSLFRAESRKTQKTKKVQKPVTLAEATKEHPAQAELVTEDVLTGFWNTTKLSGAYSTDDKRTILRRISSLRRQSRLLVKRRTRPRLLASVRRARASSNSCSTTKTSRPVFLLARHCVRYPIQVRWGGSIPPHWSLKDRGKLSFRLRLTLRIRRAGSSPALYTMSSTEGAV